MTEAFKVLRYELFADDGSGRRLIQFALPGREFETAEVLEAERLIECEFTDGNWTATKVFAPRDLRVIIWQININEQDLVHGRRLHFPEVQRYWSFFDEKAPVLGNA
ncbi:MAG: hypothetical protein WB760_19020 [Xanthobacteraceae bacterium]